MIAQGAVSHVGGGDGSGSGGGGGVCVCVGGVLAFLFEAYRKEGWCSLVGVNQKVRKKGDSSSLIGGRMCKLPLRGLTPFWTTESVSSSFPITSLAWFSTLNVELKVKQTGGTCPVANLNMGKLSCPPAVRRGGVRS